MGMRSSPHQGEDGSAVVEFLAATLILVVPLIYLVLTLAQLNAATFAASSAAREAGRIIATSGDSVDVATARDAVVLIFSDHGIEVSESTVLSVQCSNGCNPGEQAEIVITARIPLPFAPTPRWSVTVTERTLVTIDPYRGGP